MNFLYIPSVFIFSRTKSPTPPKTAFTVVILLSQETNDDVAFPSTRVDSLLPYGSELVRYMVLRDTQRSGRENDIFVGKLTLNPLSIDHILPPGHANGFVQKHQWKCAIWCDNVKFLSSLVGYG